MVKTRATKKGEQSQLKHVKKKRRQPKVPQRGRQKSAKPHAGEANFEQCCVIDLSENLESVRYFDSFTQSDKTEPFLQSNQESPSPFCSFTSQEGLHYTVEGAFSISSTLCVRNEIDTQSQSYPENTFEQTSFNSSHTELQDVSIVDVFPQSTSVIQTPVEMSPNPRDSKITRSVFSASQKDTPKTIQNISNIGKKHQLRSKKKKLPKQKMKMISSIQAIGRKSVGMFRGRSRIRNSPPTAFFSPSGKEDVSSCDGTPSSAGNHTVDYGNISTDIENDTFLSDEYEIVQDDASKPSAVDVTSYRIFKNTVDKGYYLLLPPNARIPLVGTASIKVLHGAVTINGLEITPSSKWHSIFSARIASLLTLLTSMTYSSSTSIFDEVKDNIAEDMKEEFMEFFCSNSTLLLVKRCNDSVCQYVTHYKPFTKIFATPRFSQSISPSVVEAFNDLGISLCSEHIFHQEQLPPVIIARPGYEYTVSQILSTINKGSCPVIAVCGGQGTGKSTFCRYMINRLLGSLDGICFLEADVGQTEMTPSCLLSLHNVSEPLLGLPFTHLHEPVKMHFYGATEPQQDPNLYIQMLSSLFQHYSENFQDKPLVINTNGWISGIGAALLKDIFHLANPSHLVVLHKDHNHQPLKFLDAASWSEESGSNQIKSIDLSPCITCINSDNSGNISGTKSAFNRNLTLLAYFSTLQPTLPVNRPMPMASLVPYVVPWSAVAVHVCHMAVPFRHILYALNASIVGLCRVDSSLMKEYEGSIPEDGLPKMLEGTPVCECLGLGIIRGIDAEHKLFYILTPVPLEILKSVNALIKGNHRIPSSLEFEGFDEKEVPYYINSYHSVVAGAQPSKQRKYLVRNSAGAKRLQKTRGKESNTWNSS